MSGPPNPQPRTEPVPTGGVESAWQRAAQRATIATLRALVEERDRLRKAVERHERERNQMNEALQSADSRYNRLRTRRSVQVALAASRMARRVIHRRAQKGRT